MEVLDGVGCSAKQSRPLTLQLLSWSQSAVDADQGRSGPTMQQAEVDVRMQ